MQIRENIRSNPKRVYNYQTACCATKNDIRVDKIKQKLAFPCMVNGKQRALLANGKYKHINQINPDEYIIDAYGKSRKVLSIVPSRDYMGTINIQTKKSRNLVKIPRRNSVLVQNPNLFARHVNNNWVDDVYNTSIIPHISTSSIHANIQNKHQIYTPDPQNVWSFAQNLKVSHDFVTDVNIYKLDDLVSHPFATLSYSHGFLLGAFLTCGCIRYDQMKTWVQFVLDVDKNNTHFEKVLLLCLYNLHLDNYNLSMNEPMKKKNGDRLSWKETSIKNSEIKKLNVQSALLQQLTMVIDEGHRDLPDAYLAFHKDCLKGLYDSLIHSNHYYSNTLVYDAFMHLESIFYGSDKQLGQVVKILKNNDTAEETIVDLVFTDTSDNFTSIICDHIPIATYCFDNTS